MKPPLRTAPEIAPLGPERSRLRDVVHLCLLVVPWTFVGWLWWRVGQTTTRGELLMAAALVVLVATVSLPLNVVWIIHNVRIFRRKGPRKGLAASSHVDYQADWTGRPVEADWPAVRSAAVVAVIPTAERKVFLPEEVASHGGIGLTTGVGTPVVDDAEALVAGAVAEVGV